MPTSQMAVPDSSSLTSAIPPTPCAQVAIRPSVMPILWPLSNQYVYVACETAGLVIIDVSNSRDPQLVGSYDTSGSAWAVAVSGSYAFVADYGSGLQIIDIS